MKEKEETSIQEFRQFLTQKSVPPASAFSSILAKVRADLKPSLKRVYSKILTAHLFAGALVLTVCPQLGVNLIRGNHGLMGFFMNFGPIPCAFLCGALFLSLTQLTALALLTREELRRAKSVEWLNLSLLASISLMVLILLGGQGHWTELGGWFIGALVGGWVGFELTFAAKVRFG